jgi:hypothetical protein
MKHKMKFIDCDSIVNLRNNISHPKPLISSRFRIQKLDEVHLLIIDMILACKGRKQNNFTPSITEEIAEVRFDSDLVPLARRVC